MAKELPYFKFEPSEWDSGNIQMCSRESKGLFIDLCSLYWNRLGELPYKLATNKCCNGNESLLNELVDNDIIIIDNDNIVIQFLDEQLSEFQSISKARADAGKKGGKNRSLRPEIERQAGDKLYVLRCFNEHESFIKIGITSESISRRFSGRLPYKYDLLFIHLSPDYIKIEDELNDLLIGYRYNPLQKFDGSKECYLIESIGIINEKLSSYGAKQIQSISKAEPIREEEIRKEKKKEEKKEEPLALLMPFDSDNFINIWNHWKEYKKIEFKFQYKSVQSQQSALSELNKMANGQEHVAIAIIQQSMANGWKGFVTLKAHQQNGKQQQGFSEAAARERFDKYK